VGLDKLDTYFVSVGNTVVEMFGDSSAAETGENFLTVRCADIACIVLSRQTFCEYIILYIFMCIVYPSVF